MDTIRDLLSIIFITLYQMLLIIFYSFLIFPVFQITGKVIDNEDIDIMKIISQNAINLYVNLTSGAIARVIIVLIIIRLIYFYYLTRIKQNNAE